jgi:hypothetical protein
MRNYINYVTKLEFLPAFKVAFTTQLQRAIFAQVFEAQALYRLI